MQKKPASGLIPLLQAFLWRWLIATVVSWIVGFICLLILVLFIVIIYSATTGNTSPESLQEPVYSIAAVVSLPLLYLALPCAAACVAFVWFINSHDFRRLTQTQLVTQPLPTTGIATSPAQPPADPYTQYTQAYQRWQQEYAAFQQAQKASSQPVAPPPPAPVPPTETTLLPAPLPPGPPSDNTSVS